MSAGVGWTGVPEVKVVPPPVPRPCLDRPALDALLDGVLSRRAVSVVAGAGFGKSTQLAAWAGRAPAAWYTITAEDADPLVLARGLFHALRLRVAGLVPDVSLAAQAGQGPDAVADEARRAVAYAGYLAASLDEHLHRDLVLVLDDVSEIERGTPAAKLIEALLRQAPPRLHLVLAGRGEPPFPISRLRGRGQLVEVSGAQMCFTADETEALLTGELGPAAQPLAADLHRLTHGWPAAVRLAAEAIRGVPEHRRAQALDGLALAGGHLFAYLAEEVMARLDPEVLGVARLIAPLDRVTAELAGALGVTRPGPLFDRLHRRGLFLVPLGAQGWFTLHPLIKAYAAEHLQLDDGERHAVLRTAAGWFERNDAADAALSCLEQAADHAGLAELLTEHGPRLVAAGSASRVADLTGRLPAALRTPALVQLEAEACHAQGDWDRALACLSQLAPGNGPLPPAVAWRLGLIRHLRGEIGLALDAYTRGMAHDAADGDPAPSRDRALVLAWAAAAWWLRGDGQRCRELAEAADAEAKASGDHQAAAAAHTALAMLAAIEGDRRANDAHYVRALDHAERAGDVLQIIRIRANRGSSHIDEGEYADALAELDAALRLADLAGYAMFRALALLNRGKAYYRLGRLDEAKRDLEAARSAWDALGSRQVSYPLAYLGQVHAARGEQALARGCYEEALAHADAVGDQQGTVPALAGLAMVLLPDDPDAALRYAERAASYQDSLNHPRALLALGSVALGRGDRDRADEVAEQAAAWARRWRDRATLAEALELRAAVAASTGATELARARLAEAKDIHRDLGDALGQARTDLRLAALLDGEAAVRSARAAELQARLLGARGLSAEAAKLRAALDRRDDPPVAVETLGGFRVLRAGAPVGAAEWQSRKARDLLRILVARRGLPVRREELVELLWPDDGQAGGSRLSVALSTLRAILDPDKRFDPAHFVVADRAMVRLERANIRIDVEAFLTMARGALGGAPDRPAHERLAAAEASYTGDFLADDPYEDWSGPLREEARAVYLHVTRVLAEGAAAAGEADVAARYQLRLLERDPYDEGAHLGLVRAMTAAGRHGEARRAYRGYCARMEELGVEPAPLPAGRPRARSA